MAGKPDDGKAGKAGELKSGPGTDGNPNPGGGFDTVSGGCGMFIAASGYVVTRKSLEIWPDGDPRAPGVIGSALWALTVDPTPDHRADCPRAAVAEIASISAMPPATNVFWYFIVITSRNIYRFLYRHLHHLRRENQPHNMSRAFGCCDGYVKMRPSKIGLRVSLADARSPSIVFCSGRPCRFIQVQ
jgi:hypothetical protein